MAETPSLPEREQRWLETFPERLKFFHEEIILHRGERLGDPEVAERFYGMELFFGESLEPETVREVEEKLGVNFESKPEISLVDAEENIQMVGWRTKNPDWFLVRWEREDGAQLLTYEETTLPDFAESLGLKIEES